MKKLINYILVLLGIISVVTFGWQLLELRIVGEVHVNQVDSIVGTILVASLFINFTTWLESKKQVKRELSAHEIAIINMHLDNIVCQLQDFINDGSTDKDHWTAKHDLECLQRGIMYLENTYSDSEK